MEFLFIFFGWVLPLAAVVFALASLWQILRALGTISTELSQVRRLLEEREPKL